MNNMGTIKPTNRNPFWVAHVKCMIIDHQQSHGFFMEGASEKLAIKELESLMLEWGNKNDW